MRRIRVPDPGLVVLVGAAGSGKSTWAARHLPAGSVVSSDELRGVVGTGPDDQRASPDAFAVLDSIVERRLKRRLFTCIDSTGLDPDDRVRWLAMAQAAGVACHVVTFPIDEKTAKARVKRRARAVPPKIVATQVARFDGAAAELASEGFDATWDATSTDDVRLVPAALLTDADPHGDGFDVSIELILGSPPGDGSVGGWLDEVADAALGAGIGGLWVTDHLVQVPQVGREWDPVLDPHVTLGALAGRSGRMRLGVAVSPPTFRHPVVTAKALATLDVISGGRVVCGLGLGWWEREHQMLGLEFPPVADRYRMLADTVEVLRAIWGPGSPAVHNDTWRVAEATGYPRPVQDPMPILIGGDGPARTLPLAAAVADAVNLKGDPTEVAAKVEHVRALAAEAGRDPDEVEMTHRTHLPMREPMTPTDVLADRFKALAQSGIVTELISLGSPDPERVADLALLTAPAK